METAVVTGFPPNVTPDMLRASFWTARVPDRDAVLLTPDAIAAFNAQVPERLGIPEVLDLPDTLSDARVYDEIAQYAHPTVPRYGVDGEQLDDAYFDTLFANATPDLLEEVPVYFGLVTRRTEVRAFPTPEPMTREPFAFAFDRIQETTVDIGWPVAVVATSQDGRWLFALTPGYWGWLRATDIALGTREQVAQHVHAEQSVVVIASQALVSVGGWGGINPQMGTRMPVDDESNRAFRVIVPVRTPAGALQFAPGWVAKDSDQVVSGSLPLTINSLLTQAFRLLGERYSWGGSRLGIFGRDCSRFVRDVYATTGVLLPRNGDQQEVAGRAEITFTLDMTLDERQALVVEYGQPGMICVMPGHVMLYLGAVDGVPYVIHDTSSSGYDGIIVSDLSLGATGPSGSLLQRLSSFVSP